jgi:hypothetical protein
MNNGTVPLLWVDRSIFFRLAEGHLNGHYMIDMYKFHKLDPILLQARGNSLYFY